MEDPLEENARLKRENEFFAELLVRITEGLNASVDMWRTSYVELLKRYCGGECEKILTDGGIAGGDGKVFSNNPPRF